MREETGNGKDADINMTEKNNFVDLRLYVADKTPRCLTAYENIRNICEEHVTGTYRITVIDLLKNPDLARTDDITAIPTLVRLPRSPGRRKIIGMLTNTAKVLYELDMERRTVYRNQGAIKKKLNTY